MDDDLLPMLAETKLLLSRLESKCADDLQFIERARRRLREVEEEIQRCFEL